MGWVTCNAGELFWASVTAAILDFKSTGRLGRVESATKRVGIRLKEKGGGGGISSTVNGIEEHLLDVFLSFRLRHVQQRLVNRSIHRCVGSAFEEFHEIIIKRFRVKSAVRESRLVLHMFTWFRAALLTCQLLLRSAKLFCNRKFNSFYCANIIKYFINNQKVMRCHVIDTVDEIPSGAGMAQWWEHSPPTNVETFDHLVIGLCAIQIYEIIFFSRCDPLLHKRINNSWKETKESRELQWQRFVMKFP